MEEKTLEICIFRDGEASITLPYTEHTLVEDVVIEACKQVNVNPLGRHLFGLRIVNTNIWLRLNKHIDPVQNLFPVKKCHVPLNAPNPTVRSHKIELRMRFKVPDLLRLKTFDQATYEYYFQQVRVDVLNGDIPDLVYETVKRELLGLGVTDMYRTMLEKDLSIKNIKTDYRRYISKIAVQEHRFFIKKPIKDSLTQLVNARTNKNNIKDDPQFIKNEYLKQFHIMAPEYMSETYYALMGMDGSSYSVNLRVSPFNEQYPGVRYCNDVQKKQWDLLFTIDDLCFISIRDDGAVEVSRKNGIPVYFKFDTRETMESFVSILDGYYRLMVKWTFNLCKDLITPSLQKLIKLKCHGPVGGEFSYAKIEEKRQNKHGCFILRESELKYDVFYIDACSKDSAKPKTYRIEKVCDEYVFNNDVVKYKSIVAIIEAYRTAQNDVYLNECLPPSEYDKSPLLLCATDNNNKESLTDSDSVAALISGHSWCVHPRNLQVFKGQKNESNNEATVVYRSMWRLTKGKKIEVALKALKHNKTDTHLKEFITRATQWVGLSEGCSGIVRVLGVSLSNPVGLIMEYSQYGSLSLYLREKHLQNECVQIVDLLEASSQLASALWHLEENGIVHGKIRCRKLLVFHHDEHSFTVKLTDTALHKPYGMHDVHWIPIESYSNFESARFSPWADIWSFGTTLWEIFFFGHDIPFTGDKIDLIKIYQNGKRLPKPPSCPDDMYSIILNCWETDPHRRNKPQTSMRDINQLLYQVYNSRKKHLYSKMFSKTRSNRSSLSSVCTDDTMLSQPEELLSVSAMSEFDTNFVTSSCNDDFWSSNDQNMETVDISSFTDDMSQILSNFSIKSSLDDIAGVQSIFEVDNCSNLILQGRIGEGFYGEVYRGMLELTNANNDDSTMQVAVKRLKPRTMSSSLDDFKREIAIMQSLDHPNIIRILAVLDDPEYSLVMEYAPHGALQSYLKIHRETLTICKLLKYALDVAQGMDYLAKKKIVHRDLAARNILVIDDNHVKISDFGLAQVVGKNGYYILQTNRDLPIKWYAPESLRDGKFSTFTDVWSFGVTMYEMFSLGEDPKLPDAYNKNSGQELQNLLRALERGARFGCPAQCPQSIYTQLMYPCWNIIPTKRPSFSHLERDINELLKQQ